ncbi:MAG: hypothetical protein Q8S00_18600 [Deltaproteobacteria bacterium]|nr:hypothetical protein [Deltaproteobacteria bacterium]MDZ4346912.1 hypothetical protein [Candidatus Binatia bacterium]
MAKFEKGNKRGKGGRRDPAGGRPTGEQTKVKKLVHELAGDYIEKNIQPVLETYHRLAVGKLLEFTTKKGKKVKFKLHVDPATTRHWIDKLVPNARQEINVSGGLKIVKVDAFDPDDGK